MSERLSLPVIISLGIIRGACPCACVHCPVGITPWALRQRIFAHGEMNLDVFRALCEQIRGQSVTVRLHGVGEPSLHSQFRNLLSTARGMGLHEQFWLFTCGLLPDAFLSDVVESLGIIEVSLNSTNAKDYLQTKGIDAFDMVVRNIETMQRRVAAHRLPTRIVLTRVQSDPLSDRDFVNCWRSRGFECFVRSSHSYSGLLPTEPVIPTARPTDGPKCLVPWRRLNLDGTLVPGHLVAVACFNVLFQNPAKIKGKTVLGLFPEETLLDLWNNVAYQRIRTELATNLPTGTACDRCVECLTEEGPRAEHLVQGRMTSC